MWRFFDDRVLFDPDTPHGFAWCPFLFTDWEYRGESISLPDKDISWNGYDDWVQHMPEEEEVTMVQNVLEKARTIADYRGHIRGISSAKSMQYIIEYYQSQWYHDREEKSYSLPRNVPITASISLRHAIWCEKDKRFLNTCDLHGKPYGMTFPPLRSSHDLRYLQQALRMNALLGIEVFPGDEHLIDILVEREILSPFFVSQMIQFRWKKYQ